MKYETTYGLYSSTTGIQHQSFNVPTDVSIITQIEDFMRPYIKQYFYKDLSELEKTRCFIKYYREDNENSLQLHTDNAYLTVSLCLIGEAEGSEVQFKNNAVKLDQVPTSY